MQYGGRLLKHSETASIECTRSEESPDAQLEH